MNLQQIKKNAQLVVDARKQQALNNKRNLPTKKKNRKINMHNQRCKYLQGLNKKIIESGSKKPLHKVPKAKPLLKLPYTLSPKYRNAMKRETDNLKSLQEVHPTTWLERLETIPEEIRNRIACYLFWDFVAEHKSNNGIFNRHIQEDLKDKSYKWITDEEIIIALVSLGYTPFAATRRVTKNKR